MRIHLVTFADGSMSRAADLCFRSAQQYGVDTAMQCHPYDDPALYEQNKTLLSQPRGCGYWAWKPFIILQRMSDLFVEDQDVIVYADAGIEFIDNVRYIIDRMDQDIFLFGNNWEHAHWCKRDIVDEVWHWKEDGTKTFTLPLSVVTEPEQYTWARFGKQVQASVIFFRVSDYSRKFVKEWLDWCLFEGGRLIDDSPSRTPNHPEFQENRHDQAILTTMAYREGIRLHYWPASYNDGQFVYPKLPEYESDDYPILFNHHRKRNHEWENAA